MWPRIRKEAAGFSQGNDKLSGFMKFSVQGGSNMTGTDCV
jgi:hypothetical protein